MTDEDVVYVMNWCRATGVQVHIRGTDARPVIETRYKSTKRIVGGTELKYRMEVVSRYGESG